MAVKVALAGRMSVTVAGSTFDERALGGRRPRVLFALLVLERHRAVHRDDLADALWPGELPPSWEGALRGAVSKVRSFLSAAGLTGDDVITSAFGCYQLHLPADTTVDLEWAAEAVEAAEFALAAGDARRAAELAGTARTVLALPLLADVEGAWVDRTRGRTRDLLLRSLELSSGALLDQGDAARAVAAAEEAVALEPLRESAHRALMAGHRAAGNRGQALRAYERCRGLLAEELGVDPSPETEAAYLALVGTEPAASTVTAPVPAPLRVPAPSPFVGRDDELAMLSRAWADAGGGTRRVVLVEGDAGIGKTRLASVFAARVAGAGGTVLYGSCAEDAGLPYEPFAAALLSYASQAGSPRLGPLAGELVRLAPTLGDLVPDLAPPLRAEPATERHRLFEAVVGWLAAAADDAPVALILDDLHWAPSPTVSMFRHLLRSAEPARLALVATFRGTDVERSRPLAGLFSEAHRLAGVERLVLGGLVEGEVAALMEALSDGPLEPDQRRLAAQVHAESGGNPFFATELLRHLDGGLAITHGIRAVVEARVGRLPQGDRDLLRTAAVVGSEFSVGLLVRVSESPEGDVVDAIDRATAAGLIHEVPDRPDHCQFSHALVRRALVDSLSAPRRLRLHRRIGHVLAALPNSHALVAEVAHHFSEAAPLGDTEVAVRYLQAAGDRARGQLAFEDAASHYERALTLLGEDGLADDVVADRFELRVALGDALRRAGDRRFRTVLLDAASDARALGDGNRLGRAGLVLNADWHRGAATDSKVVGLLEEALGAEVGQVLRARLLAALASELQFDNDLERREHLAIEALALARSVGDDSCLAGVLMGYPLAMSAVALHDHRLAVADELVAAGDRLGDLEAICRGQQARFDALLELGDTAAADAALAAAEQAAAELRQPLAIFEVASRGPGRAMLAGRLDDAQELMAAVMEYAAQHRIPTEISQLVYAADLTVLRYEQGRLDELTGMLVAISGPPLDRVGVPAVLALAQAEAGDLAGARATFDPLARRGFADIHPGYAWPSMMVVAAYACAAIGDTERAPIVARRLAPLQGRMTWAGAATGPVDLALGMLAALLGDHGEAQRHFAASAELCERMGAPTWLARTRAQLAQLEAPPPVIDLTTRANAPS